MKNTRTLIALLTGALLSTAAYAQVEVTITGSTAFRAITIDRAASLYDVGSLAAVTNDAAAGLITFSGTVSNKVASLHATPVKLRLSFSGSASGMLAVKNLTPVSTADSPGVNTNKVPDLALSDVFPASATPPISILAFDTETRYLGVIPFLYVKNNGLTGIANITREQAVLLMTASGDGGMPATFLGGSSPNPVYMIGRDSGSGTRITVEKDIRFVGTPTLWTTNGAGAYVQHAGHSSGGTERNVIAAKSDAIGYLGRADLTAIQASASAISFEGVAYTAANVQNGAYALWGYEHIYSRAGGLSANQALIKGALVAAITDATFQSSNPLYTVSFEQLIQMHVGRGADGGDIFSLDF
jgi:phosphate transport system substrate-binding protein